MKRSPATWIFCGSLLFAAGVGPAQAYIDPGTGSMLLQVIGAAIAGAIFYFRELRIKLMSLFGRRPAGPADADGDPPAGDAER